MGYRKISSCIFASYKLRKEVFPFSGEFSFRFRISIETKNAKTVCMSTFSKSVFVGLISMVLFSGQSLAQTTGDYRSNAASFTWTTTANWQRWNGSSWVPNPAEGYPGLNASGIAGTVTILNGHTVTLNVSPAQSIGNLEVGSGASGTLTIGNNVTARTLTMTGTVTVQAGATLQTGSTSLAHILNVGGNFINNGTVNLNTGGTSGATLTFTAGGTKEIRGNGGTITVLNFSITGGSDVVFGDNSATSRTLNINNDFTLTSGTFLSGNTGSFAHTINLTRNLTNSGIVNLTANSATNHTLVFAGAGAKTLSGTGTSTFQNVTMNTTGSVNANISSDIRIDGTVSWSANGLLVVGTNNITLGSAATFLGANSNRYIQLDGTEEVNSQVIRINNNTVGAWQLLFPIGTATGGYSPADLSASTIVTAPTFNSTLAVKAIYLASSSGRLRRVFRFIVAGNSNATQFSGGLFNYNSTTDVSSGPALGTYNNFWLERESNDVWTSPGGIAPGTINTPPTNSFFTGPSTAQTLSNDTYFFTIGNSSAYGVTWYSYQSGNWNDPLTWTTDGSVFPLYVNPTSSVPSTGDNVVITSGRTVTMNINNVTITGINVIGTLDVLATTGHNFTAISGSGKIKIAGATDNFPAGTATNFADNAVGGTLEVNGAGIEMNVAQTFNHMIVNMTGATDISIIKNNITLNGDLTISNGLLQFENTTAPANRTVAVNGHVTVASSGGIQVANSNNRHEFNLSGDFVNNGTAYFTNRVAANTAAEATDGIVDVNFLSSTRNQQGVCNGVTRFYRIEVNKGSDDTYRATISASAAGNFNLFGAANYDINSASGANDNAMGLIAGTAELGTNVTVLLNNVGNYSVFTAARLWVNGATVSKTGGNAIVPYGTVRVSAGSLTVDENSGLTLRESGIILVDGGTVTVRAIRTSTAGAGAVGSYIQSGGNVIVTGGTVSTSYAVFSLTYPGNVFNMSGGTLTIQNRPNAGDGTDGTATARGAIFINSDPANISVTGGTVVMEADNAFNYYVSSKAAFWNVIMRATGGTRNITLPTNGTTSGTGAFPDTQALTIQPLTILNDFTIESNATFVTNNANVTISGNFEIQNGGTYTHGTNTTTISSGTGVSSLVFGNTGATQTFNNLTIAKSTAADEVVIAMGRPSPNAALQVNGTFTVSGGTFDYSTFITSVTGSVSLASGVTVGKAAGTGRVALTGTTDQTLTILGASIYNLEINNTDATPQVSLASGNLTVLGTLTMTSGVLDINTRRLSLSAAASTISGTGFGTSKMIQMAGNAGDGGLEMFFNANESITYPIGTNANSTVRYTPATAQIQSFSDDGLIRITIEDRLLQLANIPEANSLSYNWRVANSNFTTLPLASFQFTYAESDADGSQAVYVPGKVLTVSPFTRSSEATSDIDISSNVLTFNGSSTGATFPGAGFTLDNAAYTAGASGMFTGTPQVFYNRANGQTGWNDDNKWSLVGFNGTATTQQPGTGDVVLMTNFGGTFDSWVFMDVDVEVAAITFSSTGGGWTPRITITNGRTVSLGVVSGTGEIMVEVNPALPTLNQTDIGDFARQASTFIYKVENDATYNMYSFAEYPTLRIEGNDGGTNNGLRVMRSTFPVTINNNLLTDWGGTFRTGADVNIVQNLLPGAGGGGGGRFQFGEGGSHTVTVGGNITSNNSGNNRIEVLNTTPSTRLHTLKVGGNITQTTGQIDLFNGTGTANNAILELNSTTAGTYTNASGNTPDLFRINMNKGSSIASTFTLSDNVTLNGPFDGTTKPLVLTNGLLILDDAAINFTLTSGGADFNIPGTAGLEVRQGAARTSTTSTNANITLDGLLRVSGGTVDINGGGATDTNYIEYSNSGNATIEVTSGTLTVAGQIRRSLVSATGILKYTQSGGTVLVGNEAAPATTRGVFEVLNMGSQFNHSGGSFTIVRSNTSATVPSLWLEPTTATITSGSTITIGNAVAFTNFGIQSTAALNNLTISGATGSVSRIYISPLTVGNNLTVSANNTLNTQNIDLNIGGNFVLNGTYTPGTNTTTFTNSGAAAISGTTAPVPFYNFTKTGIGTLSLSQNINVTRDIKVSAGTLATGASSITLTRHAEIDATITSTSGSGLIFAGTAQQQLTRSVGGASTMGIVTINNGAGVIVPDGNGYDFNITDNLRLQSGVFDIGGSLLSLGTAASITPVSAFSVTNMIQTNSSFTDKGVRKQFPISSSPAFVFPVGQLYYTPVTLGAGSTGASGTPTITVRPANRRHPIIIDDDEAGELPDPGTFDDLANVLQYYWIVSASNVASSFSSTMTLQYVQPLVSFEAPFYSEADYIAARILTDPVANPSLLINKFATTDVNEAANTISFNFSGVTQAGIAGEYFAGVPIAIPNSVPIYTTLRSGNVDGTGGVGELYSPVVAGGGVPNGARVVVSTGHTLTFNLGSVNLYETEITSGATILIPTGSIGHSLGNLSGTGNLQIESNTGSAVLPAAVYDTFLSCSGGGLIFGGTGNYEVLGGITTVRNLTLTGSGTKSLAGNDIIVCNNLTINSGSFVNANNQTITVQNDVLLNAGTFSNLNGTLTITRDLTQASGTFNGGTGGTKTIGRNLTLNGGTFTPGSGTTNIIRVNGNMDVAGVATITSGSGGATGQQFVFGGTSAQTLTGAFTTTRAFNRLQINNSNGLTVAGNTTINSELQLTSGNITNGTNVFLLGASAMVTPTAGQATSFVNGKVSKVFANGQSFTFPIGKGSRWRSGSVNNVSQTGSVTWDMEYIQGTATGAVAAAPAPRSNPVSNFTSADPLVLRMSTGEHWRVSDGSATSNGRTAIVGVSWGIESDVSTNLAQREAMKVMSWNGTDWTNNGGTNFQPGGTHTQSRGTFESTATLSFSENIVILGSTEVANALPVSLVKFEGQLNGSIVLLRWITASELNNDYFEVQRSTDGFEFIALGKVTGRGTTNNTSEYYYEDESLVKGNNYYRLKQFDYDGKSSYSKVIIINYDGATPLGITLYPNPTISQNINLKLINSTGEDVVIRIYDLAGKTQFQSIATSENLSSEMDLKTGELKAGVYIVEVVQGTQRVMKRLLIKE
jgi:hypothetical protein